MYTVGLVLLGIYFFVSLLRRTLGHSTIVDDSSKLQYDLGPKNQKSNKRPETKRAR